MLIYVIYVYIGTKWDWICTWSCTTGTLCHIPQCEAVGEIGRRIATRTALTTTARSINQFKLKHEYVTTKCMFDLIAFFP